MVVADYARRSALQGAQEGLPVGLGGVGNASTRQSFGRPASKPAAQKTLKAIRKRPVAGSRTEKGRSSSKSDPAVGQAIGR